MFLRTGITVVGCRGSIVCRRAFLRRGFFRAVFSCDLLFALLFIFAQWCFPFDFLFVV
jgi:hypothetical protein